MGRERLGDHLLLVAAGRVSSSQSNMRCSRSDRAIGSQWRSAPSEAVNGISRFTPRSLSNSCCDWPGQNCSPSGSVISNGVVIWSTTSVRLYWRAAVNTSNGDCRPYGFARHSQFCRSVGVASFIASSMNRSKSFLSPESSSCRSSGGTAFAHGSKTSYTPGSAIAAAMRCSNASARGTQ